MQQDRSQALQWFASSFCIRPSAFPSERSLKVRCLLREQEQAGALPAALTISRDANPGGGQDFTGLIVAVQLRRRVAFGLQALQRCSGLLNRRARGSTVAAHHFKGAEVRLKNSGEVPHTPGARRRGCLCLLVLPLVSPLSDAVGNSKSSASSDLPRSRSSKYQRGRLRTARLQVRLQFAIANIVTWGSYLAGLGKPILPGVPVSRACGSTRIAEGPDSESGSLGDASPFMPTISRRLASAGTADPGDLKAPRLPGASPGSPTGVWLTGNSRPVRLKPEQPWECKSPHADQSW
jgi:hypothetical protein